MKNEFDGVIERLLDAGISLPEATGILERGMIRGALQRADGNQCAAAKKLEIHRNTLQRKMTQFGLGNGRARRKPPAKAVRPRRRKTGAA
ncbi:MAG: helix-turn-helix domain-containing protein [Bryobacteraceae bacterium]|jgi:DNA-binding NtrC family response regulator